MPIIIWRGDIQKIQQVLMSISPDTPMPMYIAGDNIHVIIHATDIAGVYSIDWFDMQHKETTVCNAAELMHVIKQNPHFMVYLYDDERGI